MSVKEQMDLILEYQAAERTLMHKCDLLQRAVNTAHGALSEAAYVGGPSEREAWQTAMAALGEVVTQHQGQDAKGEVVQAPAGRLDNRDDA